MYASCSHEPGVGWLAAAATEPTAPGLGDREAAYRAIFWRAYLGSRVYGVYDALRAAASIPVAGDAAATAGFGDRRALPATLARLEHETLLRTHRDGRTRVFDLLATLPALTPSQAATLSRHLAAAHLDFLGLTPGFDLPAWWRRAEPTFTPYAVRAWGWLRVGQSPAVRKDIAGQTP